MKSVYKRLELKITEFAEEDVITTSSIGPESPEQSELENAYHANRTLQAPGDWF